MGIHANFALIDRAAIEAEIERLICLLDLADGDPDLEDGNDLEDDFRLSDYALRYGNAGPGCEISEPDAFSYSEWHTRDWRTRRRGGPEMASTASIWDHEDAEDDDPREEDDPADQNVLDMEMDVDEGAIWPIYGEDQSLGPINVIIENQRQHIIRQIADHSDGGDPKFVQQLRRRLAVIDGRASANG